MLQDEKQHTITIDDTLTITGPSINKSVDSDKTDFANALLLFIKENFEQLNPGKFMVHCCGEIPIDFDLDSDDFESSESYYLDPESDEAKEDGRELLSVLCGELITFMRDGTNR